ncbi:hypothetical protein TNCV_193921 [Trichonephila clavipes]|nr:hypothetical protein TNCV_193921 [Trichonephila clavipes]
MTDTHLNTGPLIAMDELHTSCTLNVTPEGKLPAIPSLHACTRDCLTVNISSLTHRKVSPQSKNIKPQADCAESGTEKSRVNVGCHQSRRNFPYVRLEYPAC